MFDKVKLTKEQTYEDEGYCTKEVGKCLFSDNLLGIERIEKIGDIFRLFALNKEIDESFIKKLDEYKNQDCFYSLVKITKEDFDYDFFKFLDSLKEEQTIINSFNYRNGILDKGYLEKSPYIKYSKDLRASIEMLLITEDIYLPVVCLKNRVYRMCNSYNSKFIKNVKLKNNNLILGLDTGYLIYLNKDLYTNLYIYEPDQEYVKFFKKNFLSKIETSLKIEFINDLDEFKLKNYNIDNIVIDNSVDIDVNLKYFFKLKLFNCLELVQVDNINNYFNKLRINYRNVIMSGEEKFRSVLFENYKDLKGIDSALLSAEIDFVEKCENFIKKNNIFYESYKKFQKESNSDNFLLNILRNY